MNIVILAVAFGWEHVGGGLYERVCDHGHGKRPGGWLRQARVFQLPFLFFGIVFAAAYLRCALRLLTRLALRARDLRERRRRRPPPPTAAGAAAFAEGAEPNKLPIQPKTPPDSFFSGSC